MDIKPTTYRYDSEQGLEDTSEHPAECPKVWSAPLEPKGDDREIRKLKSKMAKIRQKAERANEVDISVGRMDALSRMSMCLMRGTEDRTGKLDCSDDEATTVTSHTCTPDYVLVTGRKGLNQRVNGVYGRLNIDHDGKPVYLKVQEKCDGTINWTAAAWNVLCKMAHDVPITRELSPRFVNRVFKDMKRVEFDIPFPRLSQDTCGAEGMNPSSSAEVGIMTGRSIAGSEASSAAEPLPEEFRTVTDAQMWFYFCENTGYWYISPRIDHALAFARCAGRLTPAQADPSLLGGHSGPWEVYDKITREFVFDPCVVVVPCGNNEEILQSHS
ncbi:hypothetical protein FOL47_005112 [Perkinsus chesapeaki]|uniref:Uncharacterized protein n=1 Tax=Perkinsus chesapeaki TaxID=330153 RepID=A0A7J6M065_PERCH|nr:hypothetical protein FOL47_005112 [Perkinsus chesapeaki]